MTLSFVLPAYGEAANLEALIPRILQQRAVAGEVEIVIVDDHSADRTFEVVRAWALREPAVCGIRLAKNAGR